MLACNVYFVFFSFFLVHKSLKAAVVLRLIMGLLEDFLNQDTEFAYRVRLKVDLGRENSYAAVLHYLNKEEFAILSEDGEEGVIEAIVSKDWYLILGKLDYVHVELYGKDRRD